MKNLIIVILCLFTMSITSYSQDKPPEKKEAVTPASITLTVTVSEGNYIVSRLVGAPVKTADLIHKINSKTELLPDSKEVSIEVSVAEANTILGRLVEAPFKDVAGVVYKINEQATAQLKPAPDTAKKPVKKE